LPQSEKDTIFVFVSWKHGRQSGRHGSDFNLWPAEIKLRDGQKHVVEAYLTGKDVFFCYLTGLGKLLCFEIAPFVFEGIAEGLENAEKQMDISSVCH